MYDLFDWLKEEAPVRLLFYNNPKDTLLTYYNKRGAPLAVVATGKYERVRVRGYVQDFEVVRRDCGDECPERAAREFMWISLFDETGSLRVLSYEIPDIPRDKVVVVEGVVRARRARSGDGSTIFIITIDEVRDVEKEDEERARKWLEFKSKLLDLKAEVSKKSAVTLQEFKELLQAAGLDPGYALLDDFYIIAGLRREGGKVMVP